MRELKFRAWIERYKKYMPVAMIHFEPILGKIDYIEVVATGGDWAKFYPEEFILEQYTGLKDKNGKEIYGGDIVRWSFKVDRNSELTYTADAAKWKTYAEEEWPYSTISGFTLQESEDGYEVIGTIHENPELLKEEE